MLVSVALVFVLRPQDPATAALDRFAALAKAKNVEVVAEAAGVRMRTVLARDSKMRTEFTSPSINYVAVVTSAGWRELDRKSWQYDEFPVRRPTVPDSKLVEETSLFPNWIFKTDLREWVPAGTKFKFTGKGTVAGVSVDNIHADFSDNQIHVDVAIDAHGVPRKIETHGETPRGKFQFVWTVSGYKALASVEASEFRLDIPDGFTPRTLNMEYQPTALGDSLPLTGWVGGNGKPFDVAARLGKAGLVVAADPDSTPCQRAWVSVERLRAKKVPVVVLSTTTLARGVDAYDPTGKHWDQVRLSATPTFFWVDAKGKIIHMWQGYDQDHAGEFEDDVLKTRS